MVSLQEKRWWTVEDVAAYLSVKKSTIYSWVSDKKIPYFRRGGLVRFRQDDIDAWMESCKVEVIDKGGGHGNTHQEEG